MLSIADSFAAVEAAARLKIAKAAAIFTQGGLERGGEREGSRRGSTSQHNFLTAQFSSQPNQGGGDTAATMVMCSICA